MQEKADVYINPIGGIELYNSKSFEEKNIELKFIKSLPVIYSQLENECVPLLSIIDILMFNSREQIQEILTQYTLGKNG